MRALLLALFLSAAALAQDCPFGSAPLITSPADATGQTHTLAAWDNTIADTTTGPPVGGTLVLCRRIFFNDNPAASTQAGKNAAVSINHRAGSGTVVTNQDRALWVSTATSSDDAAVHKSITSIQAETDVYGAPSFAGQGPDSEAAGGSFQLADLHIGALSSSAFGQNAVRGMVFRRGDNWTSCPSGVCWAGVLGRAQNISKTAGNGGAMAGGVFTAEDISGTGVALVGVAVLATNYPVSSGHRFGSGNEGLRVQDFGSKATDYNIRSFGTPTTGVNYFGGPVVAGSEIVTGSSNNTDLAGSAVLPFAYTFSGKYKTPPICVTSDVTSGAAALITVSATGFTIQGVTGNIANYICVGRQMAQ